MHSLSNLMAHRREHSVNLIKHVTSEVNGVRVLACLPKPNFTCLDFKCLKNSHLKDRGDFKLK